MIRKVRNYIYRRILRIYEYNKFYSEKKKELTEKINNKKTIWFIGGAHYDNIGDQAISLITTNFLNDLNYNVIEIRLCDYYKYLKALKEIIKKDDIIVLQGGGNMCYSYFDAEYNRRCVIKEFAENKIIIFPVTIDYENNNKAQTSFKKAIKLYSKHKNLTICAREAKSYEIIKNNFKNNNVIHIPDIVLYDSFRDFKIERNGICLCLRNDREKSKFADKLKKSLNLQNCKITDNVSEIKNINISERKDIVENKMKEYASCELVITDRLHTMIFCYITRTPCLFLDNSNGKVSRVYNDWIKNTNHNIIKKIDIDNIEQDIENMKKQKLSSNEKNVLKYQFDVLKQLLEENNE